MNGFRDSTIGATSVAANPGAGDSRGSSVGRKA
jgi:hypothetical protein